MNSSPWKPPKQSRVLNRSVNAEANKLKRGRKFADKRQSKERIVQDVGEKLKKENFLFGITSDEGQGKNNFVVLWDPRQFLVCLPF